MRKILATLPIAASLLSVAPLTAHAAPVTPISEQRAVVHTMVRNVYCGPACVAERRREAERRRVEEMRRHHIEHRRP